IQRGLITEGRDGRQLRMPTAYRWVPNVTSSGTASIAPGEGDKELQDLILTVHHCFMHTLSNTPAFKIIEDHRGRAHVRMQAQQQTLLQLPPDVLEALKV
ncbi:hypothetical protein, partial [Phenylobacterium sp.]|uniref:hypothetical protein n=1 Tax=Phenylobacterium sp. TaxID=1871053 RepID=UPI00286B8D9B